MDKAQEVRHRWDRTREMKSYTMSFEQVLEDVTFLQKRVDDLERDLADALNPVSSRMGSLTHMENGELYYRINGMFIPLQAVVSGLRILNELRKSGQKLSKGMEAEEAAMFKFLEDAFKEPV